MWEDLFCLYTGIAIVTPLQFLLRFCSVHTQAVLLARPCYPYIWVLVLCCGLLAGKFSLVFFLPTVPIAILCIYSYAWRVLR